MPPPDDLLVDLAAARLLACCRRQAGPEAQADFRAAIDRLLVLHGGLVKVDGEIYVREGTLRTLFDLVTTTAVERFRAQLLPRFADKEVRTVVDRELGKMAVQLEAALHRMFSKSRMLH